MTAYKAGSVAGVLRTPPPAIRAFLLYGPDTGLVSERSAQLAHKLAGRDGEILRLDERDLMEAPDRLHVALRSAGLFGAAPIVRFAAGSRVNIESLKALFETQLDGRLIVEAGTLRPGAPLRTLFEKETRAAALPCFPDAAGLSQLIDEELKSAGLTIGRDARGALLALLGADQAVSRGEVRKLALYCSGQSEVTIGDVQNCVGDVAGAALDAFADRVGAGDAKGAIGELERLDAAGTPRQAALSVLARHLADLHRVAIAAEEKGIDAAVRGMRPPPHFSRVPVLAAQLRRLGTDGLAQALARVQETTMQSRLNAALEPALVEAMIFDIAGHGR